MDQNKVILIVDDDQRNIFALRLTLKAKGYQVLSSTSASEAMEILEANKGVALILMDMMMPEIDGYEAIQLIRNSSLMGKIPVIAVTAQAMSGDREKCLEAGAQSYVSKPIDVDKLMGEIEQLI
ncbi:Polar-differentiation response regulator DivK [compost metagenome]|uniref:Response regulator n=1 Tax=Sphingobacterium paramultivorum TaxID=2886510 RepID=A0A7G5E1B0_9SPHI|nr:MULTISPECIES: response regulator [Sphingobacterium]MBB1643181.1 histidine kinase [Sphingobacterium sp. UME9]MCS4164915.1 CheY-like chemotaxis protein [Sphingobacterium sp. BIGb0116]QMV67785.1 response regulator [Sphingobacterium paramultivorum]WSO16673.1 response regulator [Sphingobacterium paramultivorum]